ncbi:MAG: class II fumarate hydratase [Ardenticatenales bacterium]
MTSSAAAPSSTGTRPERDSLGEVPVPADALWGASTQRAVDNFEGISGLVFSRRFIHALGLVKLAAAGVNRALGDLPDELADAIEAAARDVADGAYDAHFPIDVFQTGSGTSTNTNANEVIANLANRQLGQPLGTKAPVHPNDHVNMGQSSNDVIPSVIHVAACLAIVEPETGLLASLRRLADAIDVQANANAEVVKTGRTHLMDAMPVTVGQEFGAWASQVRTAAARLEALLPELAGLAIGGTAVGTGINTRPGFGKAVAARLAALTGHPFHEAEDHFMAQATSDTAAAVSGALNAAAVSLMKVANDLRWMNSGPQAGLAEIVLPALQPGSSIMPGKINPVIPEAVTMVCAQVIGNHTTITVAAQAANFQLSVMLPVIARNLLESITFLAGAAHALADRAVRDLVVNEAHIAELVERNPILVTALNPVIGYDKAAKIAKQAYAQGRTLKDVTAEQTDLTPEQIDRHLDPVALAHPHRAR